jgi:CheY-like chemotaxis protein
MTPEHERAAESAPTILVADDDPHVRKFLVRALAKDGYAIHEASDGVEAKAAIQNVVFDLMILDLNMPEMDGFQVLQFARAKIPNLKIIVISGFMQGAMLKAAKLLGAAAILDKPIEVDFLLSTVRKVLEGGGTTQAGGV